MELKSYKETNRVPVVYKDKPLMPMRKKKADRLVKEGKAIWVQTKTLGCYLKLKFEPSGFETQDIALGVDPGSKFNGFAVVSEKTHHLNVQRNTEYVKQLQTRVERRAMFRRERRGRLRHRGIKNQFRTASKLSFSTRYRIDVKMQVINDICKLYPISTIVVEDTKFNHYIDNGGKYFSDVEVGKNTFYRLIREIPGINLVIKEGHETYHLRYEIFGEDLKDGNKGGDNFYTHCIDAYVLAAEQVNAEALVLSGTIIKEKKKSGRYSRRGLREFTGKAKMSGSGEKFYYRYGKGGKIIKFDKYHRNRKVRTKQEDTKSNHGPWNYEYIFEKRNKSSLILKRNYLRVTGERKEQKDGTFRCKSWNPKTKFYNNRLTFIKFK